MRRSLRTGSRLSRREWRVRPLPRAPPESAIDVSGDRHRPPDGRLGGPSFSRFGLCIRLADKRVAGGPVFPVLVSCMRLSCKGCPTLACCSRGWDSRMCATPLLTLSSSGNRRGQETQSSWAQNKRNSETIQRREPKPGLVNIHLIPPSRKSRESGAPALLTSRVLLRGNSAQSGSISAPNCGMSLHRKGRTQFLFSEFSEGLRATS